MMPSSCAGDEVADIEDCVSPGGIPRAADRLRKENK